MTKEIFKSIPNYEGLYEVSNMGNVKSLSGKTNKILKPFKPNNGYLKVNLFKDGKYKTLKVHQLVAMAFLNHVPCGMLLVIDHIDSNKDNNKLNNLQIITNRENVYKTQDKYSSRFKGVNWNKQYKKWRSAIMINKKRKFLGSYSDEYQAHLAYQNALISLAKE